MQQPRQNYGLGSFVKKITKKVTKPITKVASKIVPKEIAGIMRAAAPFLPPGYREAAYLLGTAKQTGRISPLDLALTAAPTFFASEKFGGKQLADRFKQTSIGQGLFGSPAQFTRGDKIVTGPQIEGFFDTEVLKGMGPVRKVSDATQGILGTGGKMFQFGDGKGLGAFRDDTKLGQLLLGGTDKEGKPTGEFSLSKILGLGIGGLSLIQSAKTPKEAGENLAAATGNPLDRQRGEELFGMLEIYLK
jgi:hypothetical protein